MNYYPFHIGDYARDTRHLTVLEHGAYRLLIDLYYLREAPLPLDPQGLCRLVCARSDDEILAVKTVLQEFFVGHPDGWRHVRCDEEIAKTREKADKAKASAAVRWSKDANAMRTHSERNAKAMLPIANSQEPIAKRKEKNKEDHPALVLPDWMPGSVWQEWRQHRKAIRKPLTAGAEDLTLRKLAAMHDAGHDPIAVLRTSIANGWTGVFEPAERSPPSTAQRSTSAADRQAEAIYRITGGLAGKPSTDERVIDVESFRQRQLAGR